MNTKINAKGMHVITHEYQSSKRETLYIFLLSTMLWFLIYIINFGAQCVRVFTNKWANLASGPNNFPLLLLYYILSLMLACFYSSLVLLLMHDFGESEYICYSIYICICATCFRHQLRSSSRSVFGGKKYLLVSPMLRNIGPVKSPKDDSNQMSMGNSKSKRKLASRKT